jgi:hypothetical protein
MDINLLIPDKDRNWIVKNNILYYKKYALLPLANYIDGELYISLDKRCINPTIKLIKYCVKKEIEFMFVDDTTIVQKFIPNEHIDAIFFNNLICICEPKIFQLIINNQINFIQILCKFIKMFDAQNRFIKVYDELKRDQFDASWFDWYDKKTHYRVKDQQIRDYYGTLFREVKIYLLLSED